MHILVYDHTYAGFLTSVFEVFNLKLTNVYITSTLENTNQLFSIVHRIQTCDKKASRVEIHLKKKTTSGFYDILKKVFEADAFNKEVLLLQIIRKMVCSKKNLEDNFSDLDILKIHQIAKKIDKEIHRMHAFVRFENTGGLYVSIINPEYNVLPMITEHFVKRYADQDWIIFDRSRNYGYLFYKGKSEFFIDENFEKKLAEKASLTKDQHKFYENLWNDYIISTNIPERKNLRLQAQHMPKKYWKNMTENKGKT